MRYLCITDGMLAENCYLLLDEASGEAAVIDPGFVNDRLLGEIAKYKVRWILLTHGHFDHIEGVDRLRALTGALLMFGRPIACTVDRLLEDGETIHVGAVPVQVLHTPGHTAGGCCYVTPEAVFTGDTLMGYSVGRCDLPTGDEAALAVSLQKLAALPGDPAICGGHGPVTRLSEEKRRNPYL